ncbi:SWIM zinc finger family protein [bacterium]|nr:SWIM zinc finger family protein [bacterium]
MFSYATPSVFRSDLQQASLGLSCDQHRPVALQARVKSNIPLLRFALRCLGQLIGSSDDDSLRVLDPIITAHPDRLILEAFSSDLAAYGRLSLPTDTLDIQGTPQWGTSNIDFTSWLWGAVGEMRSSRETWLRLGSAGFEIETLGAGGRFEPKVDPPISWYRAFLELQGAMMRPCTRLQVAAVDLLAPVRYLRYSKARMSPRALRYEAAEGGWKIVLEPWEEAFDLRLPTPETRSLRTWGRQRLRLIEPLLPFAVGVEIRLLGRAMPHFYELQLPGMTFLLGLTGWGRQSFAAEAGYSLWRGLSQPVDEDLLETRHQELSHLWTAPRQPLDEELVRRGLALWDPECRVIRYRPLTQKPLDLAKVYPPDTRLERALQLQAQVDHCQLQEMRKVKRLPTPQGPVQRELIFRDWKIAGTCQDLALEMVVSEREQILFGRCPCAFFQAHLLQRGPCEHLLALFEASRELRLPLPTSQPVVGREELPADEE